MVEQAAHADQNVRFEMDIRSDERPRADHATGGDLDVAEERRGRMNEAGRFEAGLDAGLVEALARGGGAGDDDEFAYPHPLQAGKLLLTLQLDHRQSGPGVAAELPLGVHEAIHLFPVRAEVLEDDSAGGGGAQNADAAADATARGEAFQIHGSRSARER